MNGSSGSVNKKNTSTSISSAMGISFFIIILLLFFAFYSIGK